MELDEAAVLRNIEAIVREQLGSPALELDMSVTADEVPFWDSLAHVRILVAVETAFGITFDTDELNSFDNVGDLVRAVLRQT